MVAGEGTLPSQLLLRQAASFSPTRPACGENERFDRVI